MTFEYHPINEWPPLAWAAFCSVNDPVVTVYHGPQIEIRADWFCEAVWDGDFEAGDFDATDLVFGSGARLRDGQVTFVSSGTTLDRLQSLQTAAGVWVSNSLACLLTITNKTFDATASDYHQRLGSIVQGLDKYERSLKLQNGTVQLTYFNNLRWDGSTLVEMDKPKTLRDFSSFATYCKFLLSSLNKISGNLSAEGRNCGYKLLGTLSSGYDSTTNTVLAHKAGLREVISFSNSRSGLADDGKEIANRLNIKHSIVSRNAWQAKPFAEAFFIAADAKGEDVYFAGTANQLSHRVLLTGFHGDKIWAKETYKLDTMIVRGDRSGLSLTEYRLTTGFIHLPVPFMGVQQIADVVKISISPEMKPWDIPGDYSRPICRRIVEEAGVPRNSFGMKKKAASVLFNSEEKALTPATRNAIYKWLKAHTTTESTSPYNSIKLAERFSMPLKGVRFGLRKITVIVPSPLKPTLQKWIKKLEDLDSERLLFKYAFPWAVEQTKEKYKAFHKATAQ